jgi:hypothetical protein
LIDSGRNFSLVLIFIKRIHPNSNSLSMQGFDENVDRSTL